jgi:hypothetical protein
MQNEAKIQCPECGHEIDVQDVLTHQLEDQFNKKFEQKVSLLQEDVLKTKKELLAEKKAIADAKVQQEEAFNAKVEAQIKQEKEQLTSKLKLKIKEEQADLLKEMQDELNEKSTQLKELNKSKAEVARLKREKDEMKDVIAAEAEKTLGEKLQAEKEIIQKREHEKFELLLKEKDLKLEAQKKLTEEMQRKQEQGSMQTQGETQEVAIEEYLETQFPLDSVEEIKKGARGGDCIQTVNTREQQNCGTIYYESKRTKDFQAGWIEKFKNDIRDRGADIGVLVTQAMPADMPRLGLKDGIWICTYEEFKGLCQVLRQSIVQINNAVATQENKGDKMVMLYDYLTSNEFKLQIEAIVDGFTQMQKDLDTEKRSITGHWKKREKQIEKVLLNTNFMYQSVKGIAGNAIQTVSALELPEVDDEMQDV